MVIQRSWKIQNEILIHQNVSSDDSNGSNQTISSSNANCSKSQKVKNVTTPQMAENVLLRLKQRFGSSITGQKSSPEVMRALELLRINIQAAFDKEVDIVIKKFVENYFRPTFKNIKENLGENSVSEEVLQKMSCALLENSKTQYNNRTKCNYATTNTTTAEPTLSKTENKTEICLKRPADFSTTEPTSSSKKPQLGTRRQIFWNTANLSSETRFLLDVQANVAFGFGTDGKERLANRHPELIRYLPDGQDRDWLVHHKIIPPQNRDSRFLFLIYDEVMKLGQSDLYKEQTNMNLGSLHAFQVPNFIIQKMKMFFVDLNIKSRGLITNSFSNAISSNHLRNALLQGSQAGNAAVSSTTDNSQVALLRKPKSELHPTLTALLNSNNDSLQYVTDNTMGYDLKA